MSATIDRLLTIDDLAARWGVGDEVIRRHIRDDGLPFVPLGRSAGKKPQYRFRPSAVERWEADRERVRERPEPDAAPAHVPAGTAPAAWDGKVRLRRGPGKGRGAKP